MDGNTEIRIDDSSEIEKALDEMQENELTSLAISHDFHSTDYSFLRRFKFLQSLRTLHARIDDISVIQDLVRLRRLTMMGDSRVKGEVNFSLLPNLEYAEVEYWPGGRSILSSSSLRTLIIKCLRQTEVALFSNLSNLETLEIISSAISDFDVLKSLPRLRVLRIHYDKILEDLSSIGNLTNLGALQVSNCKSFASIAGIENLKKLEYLNISDNKAIKSLTPLKDLQNLAWFYCWETMIADCDLSPLVRTPAMREVAMHSRPCYTPTVESIPKCNEQSSSATDVYEGE